MATDKDREQLDGLGEYKYGFSDPEKYVFKSRKGLSREIVEEISWMKSEPDWMRQFRLKSYEHFIQRPMPNWGPDLSGLDFDDIYYYLKPTEQSERSWDDVPEDIKRTFDRLGIPEAERKFLAGAGAMYESEVVYHNIQEELSRQGVIFLSIEDGLKEHPDLFRKYFGKLVPPGDNKFAALNSAVWSGGSFVYVPPGVHVALPLQAYFRVNAQSLGQFERTLIIADEGSYVHYVEGCFTAGARVRMQGGEKPIEEIRAGDRVLTHTGRYCRVYRTMQRPYRGTLYHIRYYGDTSRLLNVTAEHPLLVVRRQRPHERNQQFKTEWVAAQDVKPGDYLAIPVVRPVEETAGTYTTSVEIGHGRHKAVAEKINLPLTPDFFRLIGYYLAEGHVDGEHYLSFSFNEEEKDYLHDVAALLEKHFGKAPIENTPRQHGQTVVLCLTKVARLFAREFGSTAYDKGVPAWVRDASSECLAGLVQGMWRGDGSYDPKKNMFRFNTISADLAYAFRDALLRLGVAASINLQKRDAPRQPIYAVIISSPWNERFGEIVGRTAFAGKQSGSPFVLDDHYLYVPIRTMETEQTETSVYNFSVEDDESYVGEGVVSHNCTAPVYTTYSFHSGVIEIVVKRGARMRYTTVQNWSNNMYNLVTQRSAV
ncbi:MAG: Fe-S cluster assembly protein SufB, partial [Thermoflexales bacterium]|nr:Fe-S cluster assembly protein SufB [Thermoflexales bacterium]